MVDKMAALMVESTAEMTEALRDVMLAVWTAVLMVVT